jgi:tetratricopeptide (TPR) repeat protein
VADFYEILGVSRTASSVEIRKAYATLARERHPDRFSDPADKAKAQEFFKQATEAFNTLSSDRNRAQYDSEMEKPKLVDPAEIAADAYARGVRLLEARDWAGAVEVLRSAIYHAPQDARCHAALGRALSHDSRSGREAVQALEEATRLAPQSAGYHIELALVLDSLGLRIRARKVAEAAVRLAPTDPQVVRVASQLGAEGGNPSEGGGLGRFLRRKP